MTTKVLSSFATASERALRPPQASSSYARTTTCQTRCYSTSSPRMCLVSSAPSPTIGASCYAREYRAPIRFRRAEDYTAAALATADACGVVPRPRSAPAKIDGAAAKLAGYEGQVRWGIDEEGATRERADRSSDRTDSEAPRGPKGTALRGTLTPIPRQGPRRTDQPLSPDLRQVLRVRRQLAARRALHRRAGRDRERLTARSDGGRRHPAHGAAALSGAAGTPRTRCWTPTGAGARSGRSSRSPPSRASRHGQDGAGDLRPARRRRSVSLPWLPPAGSVQVSLDDWRWGIRAAQRVPLPGARPPAARRLAGPWSPTVARSMRRSQTPRTRSHAGRQGLDPRGHGEPSTVEDDDLAAHLEALDGLFAGFRPADPGRAPDRDERVPRRDRPRPISASLLDGMQQTNMDRVTFFVWRALAIEVIRRAFVADHEVDSAQTLRFAQLTPVAPCPVMTASPFDDRGPDSPGDKLTGIRLGHFSAFYRASWRANDFMWGRLDGAIRVVDLMVDVDRHRTSASSPRHSCRWSRTRTRRIGVRSSSRRSRTGNTEHTGRSHSAPDPRRQPDRRRSRDSREAADPCPLRSGRPVRDAQGGAAGARRAGGSGQQARQLHRADPARGRKHPGADQAAPSVRR